MEKGEKVIKAEVLLEVDNFLDNENDFNNIKKLINKIYDDFENKVCKNCKFHKSGYCYQPDICYWIGSSSKEGVYVDYLYLKNFGCNRFERREDEED